jgi:DNA-binding CsgD family transcriptional regulator
MGQTASSAGRPNDVEVVFLDDDIVYGDDERDVPLGREPSEGGELQFRDYYVGFWSRVLGKGSFATVKLATNRLTGHQVAVKIIKRKTRPSAAASEEELLQHIADGLATSEVASKMFISQKTVKNHLASIYEKLQARDRTQAVLMAVKMGIVKLN